LAAASEAMKFLRGVGGFGVRRVWGITWLNLRVTGVRVVYRGNYLVFGHAFQLRRRGSSAGFLTVNWWWMRWGGDVFDGVKRLYEFIPDKGLEADWVHWRWDEWQVDGRRWWRGWLPWPMGGIGREHTVRDDILVVRLAFILVLDYSWGWRWDGCRGGQWVAGLDGLDVVNGRHGGGPSDRLVWEVAVGGGVDLDDEWQEKYVHTQVVHSNESTSVLALMSLEAVQWIAKGGYV
jgi:hypothetical protein